MQLLTLLQACLSTAALAILKLVNSLLPLLLLHCLLVLLLRTALHRLSLQC
jgi:hypothetical protein